jgi:hypothetical protein
VIPGVIEALGRQKMKHLLLALSALALLVTMIPTPADASCPPGTRYDCQTTYNGKQSCGCR